MKYYRILQYTAVLAGIICCNQKETPPQYYQEEEQEEVYEAPLPKEIHDGDVVSVTNEVIERFLTEVHYPDSDYSYSEVLNYPGGPGYFDAQPCYMLKDNQLIQ